MPRLRKIELPEYILKPLIKLKPPENITVAEWAEKNRILEDKSSAIPGPWSNKVTPYLVEIMNQLQNPDTRTIIFVKPTQIGGTEVLQNMIGYVITQTPGPMMIVYPSDELAKRVSVNRLEPMILLSPALREKYKINDSSDLELQFDGMFIILNGANSPGKLSSTPCKYVFLDERDKFQGASKKEADPGKLARERTKTFDDSKVYICSTPTIKEAPIWREKENADAEKHFFVPCPHCGEFIELVFDQIKFPSEDTGLSSSQRAEQAHYICQGCEGIITDRDKPRMLNFGSWEYVRRNSEFPETVAYWINTLYSPFVRFSEIAKEFLDSYYDPDLLQNFYNSWLGLPWENSYTSVEAEEVLEKQSNCEEFVVPEWALMLTAGIDVQETSLYWVIRAWGPFLTSQKIADGQALSFQEIERIMNYEYKKANGEGLLICLAGMDSGDQTDEVYDFCYYNSEWVIPCKGVTDTMYSYKISKINKEESKAYGMQLLLVNSNFYKGSIANRIQKDMGIKNGSWYLNKGTSMEYAKQLTAEHEVREKNRSGKIVSTWKLKKAKADNHYLDCEVYAFAAADVKGVRSLYLEMEENKAPAPEANLQEINDIQNITNNESWIDKKGSWILDGR